MLEGLVGHDHPLTVTTLLERMRTVNAGSEILTLRAPGRVDRTRFGALAARADRVACALAELGIQQGDRVGTFMWNSQEHQELYLGVPCYGAVLHTLNLRLFPEHITYIARHAADRVMFIDDSLVPIIEPIAHTLETVEHFIVVGDGDAGSLPNAIRYEELLASQPEGFDYPVLDDRAAAALCYTSGTTGDPKGVLYSHRSTVLHAMAVCMTDGFGVGAHDRVLAIVPLFHANAWGLPFACAMTGADLIMPTKYLQAEPLTKLIENERVTIAGGVPTIWADVLRYADEHAPDLSSLRFVACGGSAVPRSLIEGFETRHGVVLTQVWGMTELSPLGAVARPHRDGGKDEGWRKRLTAGRVIPQVELRLVGDDGEPVPWDDESTGEIQVRGPWIATAYYRDQAPEKFDAGWLRTGDVGAMSADGYVRITDRAKDVIKSGGEWISSIELETVLMDHPSVREAAVIAKSDERWFERPLACVVTETEVSPDELVEHLRGRVVKWWIPEEFAYIDEVPKTSVGKFDKKVLRARLEAGELDGCRRSAASTTPA